MTKLTKPAFIFSRHMAPVLRNKLSLLTRPQSALKFSELKLGQSYPIVSFEASSTRHGDQQIESVAVFIRFSNGTQEEPIVRKLYLPKRFEQIKNEISFLNSELEQGSMRLNLKWLGPCSNSHIVDISEQN